MNNLLNNLIDAMEDAKQKYSKINNCLVLIENDTELSDMQKHFVKQLLSVNEIPYSTLEDDLTDELEDVIILLTKLEICIDMLEQNKELDEMMSLFANKFNKTA